MAISPNNVLVSEALVRLAEEYIDARVTNTGSLKSSVELKSSISQATSQLKILHTRDAFCRRLQSLYLQAGWTTVAIEVTGPHGDGCSGSQEYYKVSYELS